MSQITLTLAETDRVKEIFPGVYIFNVTAAKALSRLCKEYVDKYFDGSENDYWKLSKMYPDPTKKDPFVNTDYRHCFTAGNNLLNLSGDYKIIHDLVYDSFNEMQAIFYQDLNLKYNFSKSCGYELLVYPEESGLFDWHQDVRRNGRSGTYLFYVNDDYEGGELEFKYIRDADGERVKYKPKEGELLVMPTTWYTEHRSRVSTSGTKIYILAQVTD